MPAFLTSINVLKYIIPLFLGFMIGFYLAEHVTTRIYNVQQDKLKLEYTAQISELQSKLTKVIEDQNTATDVLNSTSSALAEANRKLSAKSVSEDQKAIIKYKDKVVLVKETCKLSDPGLEYIREHITGK
jgi:hypothetical protein